MIGFADNLIHDDVCFLHSRNLESSYEMTICYGTDGSFMMGAAVSCASVAYLNKNVNISIHIFTDNIDDFYLVGFEKLARQEKISIYIHVIDISALERLPKNRLWSTAIYYRFIIADYFYGKKDVILYLDSDIICLGELEPIFLTEMKECSVGAVLERDHHWWAKRANKLECKKISDGYYNSGVLLINTREWHESNITQKAIDLLRDETVISKLTYFDQDVLNMITCDSVVLLNKCYNVQYSLNYELNNKHQRPFFDEIVLLHYIGPTKPWHSYASHYPIAAPYTSIKQRSPWQNIPSQSPRTSMQLRYAAKHFMKNRQILLAAKNYILYLKSKLATIS